MPVPQFGNIERRGAGYDEPEVLPSDPPPADERIAVLEAKVSELQRTVMDLLRRTRLTNERSHFTERKIRG